MIDCPDLAITLQKLIAHGDHRALFSSHFQPIVNLQSRSIMGYEVLTRGPSDSALHMPGLLFDVAAQAGHLVELERILIRLSVRRFVEARLPGSLFINVSTDTLLANVERLEQLRDELRQVHLAPTRVVVEVTEMRPVADAMQLLMAVRRLRALGIEIALDGMGEHLPGLQRWVAMRPDYVKIDRHYINNISQDPALLEFVSSIHASASSVGSCVIAVGLEQEADMRVLRELGINSCQGYLLGRPTARPSSGLTPDTEALLLRTQAGRQGGGFTSRGGARVANAEQLSRRVHVVTEALTCAEVVSLFQEDPELYSLPVLDQDERPAGLLRRLRVLARASDRYFIDLFGKRSCGLLMDRQPLCFETVTPLRAMAEAVVGMREEYIIDGFIVTRHGRYFGSGRVTDLLKAVSDAQLLSARYANPLTLLPGNVQIDGHVDRLLEQGLAFHAAHFDLNHFKPFNDIYGYKKGDEVILLCANIIQQHLDEAQDFLGHIGGDDFVVTFQSMNWENRVQGILTAFDQQVAHFFSEAHRAAGAYLTQDRKGVETLQPLTSLSVGIVSVLPGEYENHAELSNAASNAKKMAKRANGSSYFVERRYNRRSLVEPASAAENTG